MTRPDPESLVQTIMQEFARRTGLDPHTPSSQRYFWPDAFAVCNYLDLYRRTPCRSRSTSPASSWGRTTWSAPVCSD